ncbi:hypothetical protein P692DRAFT_20829810 [Suillus brevipes Sb2]|nr:hypothetical protein P692DRAFT_201785567 [Suillus brevipes Sb2]KAG2752913.1 hypothetical protein P692DRAFT_20829810 [Suillus brevipes Sb2]
MVNRRISQDVKEHALTLWDHGWEVEDICEVLGVSRASCFRWRHMFDELGTVARPPSPLVGRTRIITRALMTAIEDLFTEESDLFLDEICTWLEHGITISSSSLSRSLKQAGLSRKMLQKIARERDDARREEFKDGLRMALLPTRTPTRQLLPHHFLLQEFWLTSLPRRGALSSQHC